MKKLLPILLGLLLLFSFSSCTKTVVGPGTVPVTGSWILVETAQNNGYGWQYFNSPLANGVFDFYSSGAAEYNDNYTYMRGNWYSRFASGAYYDRYGNYYSGSHQTFEVHMTDRSGGSVDLFFDEIVFAGNDLIATYYDGHYVSRYVFRRY